MEYGKDVLCPNIFGGYSGEDNLDNLESDVATYPISDETKAALIRLMTSETDYLGGKSHAEKLDILRKISYTDFIARYTDTPKAVTDIIRDYPRGIWGVGWDACSALEGYRWGNPGMGHLGLTDVDLGWMGDHEEPYIFHFPDGNAGVARSLVRALLPNAVPGKTMEDLVRSRVDYALLDLPGSNVRIRLNSTAVVCAQPSLMHSFGMDFPVSMGGYDYTSESGQPTVLHGTWCPAVPDQGLSNIQQHKRGRRDLFAMSFDDFEDKIVSQLSGALSGGGFDPGRDIAGITVNRWPHGYAYEYNELYDDPSFGPDKGPHLAARKQIGRISIANSDASAYAYVDGAIDAADRAVNEQLGT